MGKADRQIIKNIIQTSLKFGKNKVLNTEHFPLNILQCKRSNSILCMLFQRGDMAVAMVTRLFLKAKIKDVADMTHCNNNSHDHGIQEDKII